MDEGGRGLTDIIHKWDFECRGIGIYQDGAGKLFAVVAIPVDVPQISPQQVMDYNDGAKVQFGAIGGFK